MEPIEVLVQQLINGVMLGLLYGLIAVGFTLFFGVLDIIHFGHGDVFMMGSFVALALFSIIESAGIAMHPVLLLVLLFVGSSIIMAIVGVAAERLFIKPVSNGPMLISLLVTLGLSITLREAVRVFYPRGSDPKFFPRLLSDGFFEVGNIIIRYDNIILFVLAAVVMFVLYIIINRTKIGSAIRAVAQDGEAAMMMGVNRDLTVDIVFIIGSVIAAIAGVMYGLYYGQTFFNIGAIAGVIGFSAAVIGGLGNVYGAIVGGLLFGLVETFSAALLPSGSENRRVFAFLVVLLFLVLRPGGILGEKTHERV